VASLAKGYEVVRVVIEGIMVPMVNSKRIAIRGVVGVMTPGATPVSGILYLTGNSRPFGGVNTFNRGFQMGQIKSPS